RPWRGAKVFGAWCWRPAIAIPLPGRSMSVPASRAAGRCSTIPIPNGRCSTKSRWRHEKRRAFLPAVLLIQSLRPDGNREARCRRRAVVHRRRVVAVVVRRGVDDRRGAIVVAVIPVVVVGPTVVVVPTTVAPPGGAGRRRDGEGGDHEADRQADALPDRHDSLLGLSPDWHAAAAACTSRTPCRRSSSAQVSSNRRAT